MARWQRIHNNTLPELHRHYLAFEPYCHLNVVDLWSYRAGTNYWRRHGDTIAYRLNDYMDDSYYVTLLGKESVKPAIAQLANEAEGGSLILKCVPDSVVEQIKDWEAVVSLDEDRDNHDYIFDVDALTSEAHPRLKAYRKFKRKFPNVHVEALDHFRPADRRRLYGMFKRWIAQTNPEEWQKELLALRRALNQTHTKLECLAFMNGKKIIGFTINADEESGYYQAYFGKADRRYPNLTLFQEIETAKYMRDKYGSRYLNLQPDSGIAGLRSFKSSLIPTRMLKKYVVTIDTQKARLG